MALLSNNSIWPDDTRRAAVTLALASVTNSDMQFHDVIDSTKDALNGGRPLQFVMELIRLLTAGLGEQFSDLDTAAAYRQMAAEAQAVRGRYACARRMEVMTKDGGKLCGPFGVGKCGMNNAGVI